MFEEVAKLIVDVQQQGASALALFALFAFIGGIAFIPRTPTLLLGGFLFGLDAAPVGLLSATLASAVCFWAARNLFAEPVRAYVNKRPRLQLTLRAIDEDGWKLLALLRLWGPVPATVQNYAFALSTMRFLPFLLISLVFGAPQAFAYAFLGSAGGKVFRAGLSGGAELASAAAACACLLAMGLLITRRLRRLIAADRLADQE